MSPKLNADLGTFRVGVDFGTSNTVAMLGWPDGRTRSVLFDGAPILPSAVFADRPGELLVGRDAVSAALSYPERFEPYPKRRIDDGVLLLGDAAIPVNEAIAAVLRRVVTETHRVAGQWPADVIMTYPASWGARRRGSLLDGAARAGIHHPRLVPEPLASSRNPVRSGTRPPSPRPATRVTTTSRPASSRCSSRWTACGGPPPAP